MNKLRGNLVGSLLLSISVLVFSTEILAWSMKDTWEKTKETVGTTVDKTQKAVGLDKKESEETTSEQKDYSVAEDAAKGAIVCGGLAKVFGKGNATVAKAAVACGAANAAVTVLANQGKKEYSDKYADINNDIAATEKEIQALEKETTVNNKKAVSYKSEVDKLVSKEKDDKKFLSKASDLRQELDGQLRSNKMAKSKAEAKLEILDKQVVDMDEIIKDSPDIDSLKTTKTALLSQKKRLTESVKQANGVNDALLAQKTKLDSEIIKRS